jgi:hypothetical protein
MCEKYCVAVLSAIKHRSTKDRDMGQWVWLHPGMFKNGLLRRKSELITSDEAPRAVAFTRDNCKRKVPVWGW